MGISSLLLLRYGDTLRLKFSSTGNSGQGLQVADLALRVIPEPSRALLVLLGGIGLLFPRRR